MIETKVFFPAVWLALIMYVSTSWMFWIFLMNIVVFIYKGVALPYSSPSLGLDVTYYCVWGLITLCRHSIGSHGLARGEPFALFSFVVITLFAIIGGNLYFTNYQTYILRIDLVLNAFCMAVECLEALLALICGIHYTRARRI